MELNKYSKTITQDITQPAAQAMLYGIGLTEEDLKKEYPYWQIEKYSSNEIILYKEFNSNCRSARYYINI